MKLVERTPLSVAARAGRTAWQSFHKGGIYKKETDDLLEDDFKFLDRLFNKYKHISVAEHIWYTFELNKNIKDELFYIKDEYNFFSETEDKFIFSCNLRTILENKENEFYKRIIDNLPDIHSNLILEKEFVKGEDDFTFISKTSENNLGHKVTLLYENNIIYDYTFNRRPHIFYSFNIENISRALLQELVRHDDLLGITVKSTRYTLKELKEEEPFEYQDIIGLRDGHEEIFYRAKKYLVWTGEKVIDTKSIIALENLRELLSFGISNDKAKFTLPESYRTSCVITLNKQNLDNFLKLRLDKSALWEIQELAKIIRDIV